MDAQRGMPPPPQAQQHAGYSQQQQYSPPPVQQAGGYNQQQYSPPPLQQQQVGYGQPQQQTYDQWGRPQYAQPSQGLLAPPQAQSGAPPPLGMPSLGPAHGYRNTQPTPTAMEAVPPRPGAASAPARAYS
eukprot:gene38525-64064_t